MTTEGVIHFLDRDSLYGSQKPYSLRFAPEAIAQTNLKPVKRKVKIKDIREQQEVEQLDFESCGFGVVTMNSDLSYDDFFVRERVKSTYYLEIGTMLKDLFGARYVYILDHVIRVRHEQFPISTGMNYEFDQPTTLAHVDFTHRGARDMIQKYLDLDETLTADASWKCVNVWKPLRGPILDWPLALCSAATMDFPKDSIAGDVVAPAGPLEDLHIHFNENQEWYYLSRQHVSELLIFQSSDSRGKLGAPHASFPLANVESGAPARQSIEVRAYVFF